MGNIIHLSLGGEIGKKHNILSRHVVICFVKLFRKQALTSSPIASVSTPTLVGQALLVILGLFTSFVLIGNKFELSKIDFTLCIGFETEGQILPPSDYLKNGREET